MRDLSRDAAEFLPMAVAIRRHYAIRVEATTYAPWPDTHRLPHTLQSQWAEELGIKATELVMALGLEARAVFDAKHPRRTSSGQRQRERGTRDKRWWGPRFDGNGPAGDYVAAKWEVVHYRQHSLACKIPGGNWNCLRCAALAKARKAMAAIAANRPTCPLP